ncbi:MAG: M48 family metalloprotease [Candidatus Lokiarchaeota archaeon]|nr:M48 family metalloprotease [Candidatus Lokiarchaeota archaeon]
MGLKLASTLAVMFLFALIYAVVFTIGVWFLPSNLFGLLIMIAFTILIVLFQYGMGPIFIRWMYRIDWISYEDFTYRYPHLADAVDKVVAIQEIKTPRMGIIHDDNPQAFTFGYTKNSARMVITDGILHYLDEHEQRAVVAHELGHIVHNDFILMTVVFAIPLILLTIARWSYYAVRFSGLRRSRDDDAGSYIALALIIVAIVSYISYYIGFLVSLFVSRIREYFADQHAAELTENPNLLSTALIKIAYGLLATGTEAEIKQKQKSNVRALRGLGIFDPKKAATIAVQTMDSNGQISKRVIEAAAGWDLFNPWAKYFQAFSTHPLTAKRILRLNEQCPIYGVPVEYDLSGARAIKEQQVGKSMAGEFITDLFIKTLPTIIFTILSIFTIFWFLGSFGLLAIGALTTINNLILLWTIGFIIMGFGVIIRTSFMYRKRFTPSNVVDLVTTINVSPVRPVPGIIEGKIIGKGIPGHWLSEDLYFRDNTGRMHIDYRYGFKLMDFWWALRRADRLVGQNVRIQGWYRRGPSPYFQVDTIWTQEGRRFRNYSRHMTYILAVIFFLIGAFLFYLWFAVI